MHAVKKSKSSYSKVIKIRVWQRKTSRNYIHDFSASIDLPTVKPEFHQGGGIDINRNKAKKIATYESIERYCGSVIPTNKIEFSVSQIKEKEKFIHPKDLIMFHKSQYIDGFRYKRFKENDAIEWVVGYSHGKNDKLLVPAFIVFLGYNLCNPNISWFSPSSSSGLAIYYNYPEAVKRGVLELVERDAAMKVWLKRKITPRLNLKTLKSVKLRYLINKLNNEGLKVELVIATQEINIPSVIAITYAKEKIKPYASFGLSAGEDLEAVSLKALQEAIMVRNTLDELKSSKKLKKISNILEIREFIDHVIYYAQPETADKWKFFLRGRLYSVDEIENLFSFYPHKSYDLNTIRRILDAHDLDIISVDLSNDISKQLGLFSIRVVIPGMMQMDYDYNARCLRYPGCNLSVDSLNQDPHPFG